MAQPLRVSVLNCLQCPLSPRRFHHKLAPRGGPQAQEWRDHPATPRRRVLWGKPLAPLQRPHSPGIHLARPQGQPGGMWMGCVREGWEVRPQNLPRWRRPRARRPLLPPTTLAVLCPPGLVGRVSGRPGGHLPVGASQGAGAGEPGMSESPCSQANDMSAHTQRPVLPRGQSPGGQGRAVTGTRPSCEASSPSPAVCPIPETSRAPVLARCPPAHLLSCLTPGPRAQHPWPPTQACRAGATGRRVWPSTVCPPLQSPGPRGRTVG